MKKRSLSLLVAALLLASVSCKHNNDKTPEDKVWLHRVNTIEKARYYQHDYPGFEIDLHYIDSLQDFLIEHDATEGSTLTFDEWCAALENVSTMGLWLDFKNLTDQNKEAAAQRLVALRNKHKLQGKMYVESPMYANLSVFQNEGFLVSYYIPYFNPNNLDSAQYQRLLKWTNDAISTGVNAISGDYIQYDFMKKEFPDHTKLIWTTVLDTTFHRTVLDQLNADPTVDVILLPNENPIPLPHE